MQRHEGTAAYTNSDLATQSTSVSTTFLGPEIRIFADERACAAPDWPNQFHDEIAYLNWQWRLEQVRKANRAYARRQERHSILPRLHRQLQRSIRQDKRSCRAPERIKHARRRCQPRK